MKHNINYEEGKKKKVDKRTEIVSILLTGVQKKFAVIIRCESPSKYVWPLVSIIDFCKVLFPSKPLFKSSSLVKIYCGKSKQ